MFIRLCGIFASYILAILNSERTLLAVLSARQKSIMSDFVVWARVRRQIEVMLIEGNMGRCSKGKLWKKDIIELREIEREQIE